MHQTGPTPPSSPVPRKQMPATPSSLDAASPVSPNPVSQNPASPLPVSVLPMAEPVCSTSHSRPLDPARRMTVEDRSAITEALVSFERAHPRLSEDIRILQARATTVGRVVGLSALATGITLTASLIFSTAPVAASPLAKMVGFLVAVAIVVAGARLDRRFAGTFNREQALREWSDTQEKSQSSSASSETRASEDLLRGVRALLLDGQPTEAFEALKRAAEGQQKPIERIWNAHLSLRCLEKLSGAEQFDRLLAELVERGLKEPTVEQCRAFHRGLFAIVLRKMEDSKFAFPTSKTNEVHPYINTERIGWLRRLAVAAGLPTSRERGFYAERLGNLSIQVDAELPACAQQLRILKNLLLGERPVLSRRASRSYARQ